MAFAQIFLGTIIISLTIIGASVSVILVTKSIMDKIKKDKEEIEKEE